MHISCKKNRCPTSKKYFSFVINQDFFILILFFLFFAHARSLNELRVLLLESHRHSRDMEKDLGREVHKAEWKVKEQKLQDDIKTLREKLLLLVRIKDLLIYMNFLKFYCF